MFLEGLPLTRNYHILSVLSIYRWVDCLKGIGDLHKTLEEQVIQMGLEPSKLMGS